MLTLAGWLEQGTQSGTGRLLLFLLVQPTTRWLGKCLVWCYDASSLLCCLSPVPGIRKLPGIQCILVRPRFSIIAGLLSPWPCPLKHSSCL